MTWMVGVFRNAQLSRNSWDGFQIPGFYEVYKNGYIAHKDYTTLPSKRLRASKSPF